LEAALAFAFPPHSYGHDSRYQPFRRMSGSSLKGSKKEASQSHGL
jgi:hypothetical protein